MQLLDSAYERVWILLQILGNPRTETEMVIRGSEAVGREVDQTRPQICMSDAREQALVVDPSPVRVEAAHPRTLRPTEQGSHFTSAIHGLAPAVPFAKPLPEPLSRRPIDPGPDGNEATERETGRFVCRAGSRTSGGFLAGWLSMSSGQWSTHGVELGSRSAIKRFRGEHREQAEREWRALTLLARYAPGLAPEPWEADLDAPEPTVVMSRLSGDPLRGRSLDDGHIKALAATLSRLYVAVPPDALAAVPRRPGHQQQLIAQIRSWTPQTQAQAGDEVSRAVNRGPAWLDDSGMETADQPDVPPVFGPGDGNLANYL